MYKLDGTTVGSVRESKESAYIDQAVTYQVGAQIFRAYLQAGAIQTKPLFTVPSSDDIADVYVHDNYTLVKY